MKISEYITTWLIIICCVILSNLIAGKLYKNKNNKILTICITFSALFSVIVSILFQPDIDLIFIYIMLFFSLAIISYTDIISHKINTVMIIFIFILACPSACIADISIISRFFGGIVISLPMLIISLKSDRGIGLGDILLISATGFLLGAKTNILGVFIGIFLAVCFSLLKNKNKDKDFKIALAPWLSLGISTAIIFL